jgi:hypothetical protein
VTPNTSSPPTGRSPARLVAAAACLAAPFVGLLWVPWYARDEPRLVGMPFFYWYLFAWVPASAVLMFAAYLLLRRAPGGSR